MKRSVVFASAALVMTTLAGCSDSTDAYCGSLEEAKGEFSALSENDFAQMDQALERAREIGADAPDEIKDEWEAVTGALSDVQAALQEAGLTFEDLGGLQTGQIPENLDQDKLLELSTKMQDFDLQAIEEASEKISTHAQEECDVDLQS